MSSESEEYREPAARRRSSTPDTPRKRQRLASTDSSRRRNHKEFRRYDVENKYSDDYRLLFNKHAALAAARFEVDDLVQHRSEQIGSSQWSNKEQAIFFAALERLGRNDLPGIAGAVETKTEAETRDFLLSLQDGAQRRGDSKLTLRDVPAAIELGSSCDRRLEDAADALAWYQERFEAEQEQERYGNHWLITPQIAEELEHAVDGAVRARRASTPQATHTKRSGSGVAGSCTACKQRKRRCDRGTPCRNCTRSNTECVYSEVALDVDGVKNTFNHVPRPPNASTGTSAVACVACKKEKKTCDHETPCVRCVSLRIECEYPTSDRKRLAGACCRCKKHKIKCDREIPCTNCTHSKADCVYPNTPTLNPNPASDAAQWDREDDNLLMDGVAETSILQLIPEAKLLKPQVMLRLSTDLFMNRSPEFSSPWPHWSEYTSELAVEPSMYRTAFNDFHRLVVSVTKRLVHTTLMQTTSRLRAQRLRTKNGIMPFVKKRDVHSAIDVLGLKRDGRDRWSGVPRRCGLKVVTSTSTARGNRHTVMPWNELERIMSSASGLNEATYTTDADSSTEPEKFKFKAARSGTPLPMQNLTLSDSGDDLEPDTLSSGADDGLVEDSAEKEERSMGHKPFRHRDPNGRYLSAPPGVEVENPLQQLRTLEHFDQEASLQEEHALWDMLGMEPTVKDDRKKTDEDLEDLETERLATKVDDWRGTVQYCAPWEAYSKPVPAAKFSATRRSLSPMPTAYDRRSLSSRSLSGVLSDDSSMSGTRRPRRRSTMPVELRAHGATAYAALQGEDLGISDQDMTSSSSDEADKDDRVFEKDIPAQSIEDDISDHESSIG
ncbi:hypothetical protein CC86DRAFT_373887 [Ophiobolus disseminans]|uniref:Zn(2)-C6 fungal-type domain-containing protein n=1 Tax=Ophiobolus disseminans TaxID=1469910 RepID=A0A6A6ZIY6_9PLEO|nr:hypothetical protein CC86DRAFT_373887 [Ophiobolus disseminans]